MEKRTSCPFSRRVRGSAFRSQYCLFVLVDVEEGEEVEEVVGLLAVVVVVVRGRLVGGSCGFY